jgi:hypothetical protein
MFPTLLTEKPVLQWDFLVTIENILQPLEKHMLRVPESSCGSYSYSCSYLKQWIDQIMCGKKVGIGYATEYYINKDK